MAKQQKPYFLWDYDLTDKKIREILRGENETEKVWIASRILESARYEDIWNFLSLAEIKKIYPKLKLKRPIKEAWDYALHVWSN